MAWLLRKALHFFGIFPEDESQPHREILVGVNQDLYAQNKVITSKYHFYDFLPRNLFEQFQRVANFYFLVIAVILTIPGVSPVNPWISMMPLIFVLGVSAIKEAREDYFRHKQDDEVNNRPVYVFDHESKSFRNTIWKDLSVGDIVKIHDREYFPADLLLVKSSSDESICYIETANLDGETNLKVRQAHSEIHKAVSTLFELVLMKDGVIKCEHPNNHLYKFEGNIKFGNMDTLSIDNNQILLRGCQLRNTEWISGVVIFAGHDTKLMKNSADSKVKTSSIEMNLNGYIFSVFGILIALSILSGILGGVFVHDKKTDAWYLDFSGESATLYGGMGILTYMILYNTLIPISLYVSIEMVKVVQAILINQDLEMYHAETDTPAKARTSNLSDELGEIEYIFSDKTGTLTRNIMEFKKCSIGGVVYGTLDNSSLSESSDYVFGDSRIWSDIKAKGEQATKIHNFMLLMGLCHTVIPEIPKDVPQSDDTIIYQAASPDEGALVNAARYFKFKFKARTPTTVTINVDGKDEEWALLNTIEFDSNRKRMSIIARSPEGKIMLFCKGADSIMFPRFMAGQEAQITQMKRHLDDFGADGLRTLCLGMKEIPQEEYQAWNKTYTEASISLVERERLMEEAADVMERGLSIVGASAIEDKLQDGVPECIQMLRDAGLRIWVLTGDKQETAINIGFSCRLIDREMSLVIVNARDAEETRSILRERYQFETQDQKKADIGLVIDGATLNFSLNECKEDFLRLAKISKSVICCRVSPLQKARVVKLMKDAVGAMSLSIGDGANDVSMIKEAHIGIGISGQEGMQAVMSSDYAIAQFRFLLPLLLIHGRWSYVRVSQIIRYSFYKNMIFTLSSLWFSIYTGFSGQTLLDSFYIAVFNVFFTSLPIMGIAVFDRDISKRDTYANPQIFTYRQRTDRFNAKSFWTWIFDGVVHSLLCFYFPYLAFGNATSSLSDGKSGADSLWALGTTSYTCIVLMANLKIAFMTCTWTWWNWFFTIGSVLIWFICVAIYHSINAVGIAELYGVFHILASTPAFWFTIIATPILGCSIDFAVTSYFKFTNPTATDIIRERSVMRRRQHKVLTSVSGAHSGSSRFKNAASLDEPIESI